MRSNLFFPATCASEKTLLRPQTCELETQTKPSEAGLFGRGGARERSDAWPLGRDERCGLCPDDVRCSRLHPFEKMLAFLREAVDFVDSLSLRSHGNGGSACRKSRSASNLAQEPRRVPSSADDGIKSNLFFPATCASEKTLLRPQTCERSRRGCAVRCSGLHLFEKMLAFLREAVDFVDSLSLRSHGNGGFFVRSACPSGS